MAGVLFPNQPTYFVDSTLVAARNAEYAGDPLSDTGAGTAADPRLGCNDAGSCAMGIGINTGDYSPKPTDWPEIEQLAESQAIGEDQSGLFNRDATFGIDSLVGFGPADALAAPDANMTVDVAGSGFNTVNRTGAAVPSGAWTWGAINNP